MPLNEFAQEFVPGSAALASAADVNGAGPSGVQLSAPSAAGQTTLRTALSSRSRAFIPSSRGTTPGPAPGAASGYGASVPVGQGAWQPLGHEGSQPGMPPPPPPGPCPGPGVGPGPGMAVHGVPQWSQDGLGVTATSAHPAPVMASAPNAAGGMQAPTTWGSPTGDSWGASYLNPQASEFTPGALSNAWVAESAAVQEVSSAPSAWPHPNGTGGHDATGATDWAAVARAASTVAASQAAPAPAHLVDVAPSSTMAAEVWSDHVPAAPVGATHVLGSGAAAPASALSAPHAQSSASGGSASGPSATASRATPDARASAAGVLGAAGSGASASAAVAESAGTAASAASVAGAASANASGTSGAGAAAAGAGVGSGQPVLDIDAETWLLAKAQQRRQEQQRSEAPPSTQGNLRNGHASEQEERRETERESSHQDDDDDLDDDVGSRRDAEDSESDARDSEEARSEDEDDDDDEFSSCASEEFFDAREIEEEERLVRPASLPQAGALRSPVLRQRQQPRQSSQGSRASPDHGKSAVPLSIAEMLRWRHAALRENLRDERVRFGVEGAAALDGARTPASHSRGGGDRSSGGAAGSRARGGGDRGGANPSAGERGRDRDQGPQDRSDADACWRSTGTSAASGAGGHFPDRRKRGDDERGDRADGPKLEVSSSSWVAQQLAHRRERAATAKSSDSDAGNSGASDAEVLRSMKAILNKLTVEKFEPLYEQLIDCGISTASHVEALMREVFEKATMQHHFVGMYAELCVRLHRWFVHIRGDGEEGKVFKRILLNRCQHSFEEILRPQEFGDIPDAERREEAEQLHKMRMLGNLKLVGALLERNMLAGKILVEVVEELLSGDAPSAASLESLAVFLTAVGPTFDRRLDWVHRPFLIHTFERIREQIKRRGVPARTRFLLQDLLDLRAANWENRKKAVRSTEGPTTLDAVHKRAEEELGERLTPLRRGGEKGGGGGAGASGALRAQGRGSAGGGSSGRGYPSRQSGRANSPTLSRADSKGNRSERTPSGPAVFDRFKFREAVAVALRMLSCEEGKVDEALKRLVDAQPALPSPEEQSSEFLDLVVCVAGVKSAAARRNGFNLAAQLFVAGPWAHQALRHGLDLFFAPEQLADTRMDVPALSRILLEDMAPILASLVSGGILDQSTRDRYLSAVRALK